MSAVNDKQEERPTPNALPPLQGPSPTPHEPAVAHPPLSPGPSETHPAVQPKALAPQPVNAVNAAQQHAVPTPTPTFVEEPATQPPQPVSAVSDEPKDATPRGVPPLQEAPSTSFPAAGVAAPTAGAVVEVSPPPANPKPFALSCCDTCSGTTNAATYCSDPARHTAPIFKDRPF